MSTMPLDDVLDPEESGFAPFGSLSPKAIAYFVVVLAATLAVTVPFLIRIDQNTQGWLTFAILAVAVALAQFYVVRTPGNKSYHTTGVFLIAAVLLLPPELVAPIALLQHVPEWLKTRLTWYVQTFNILNYTLATMAAWASAHVVINLETAIPNDDLRFAAAGMTAAAVLWR